MSNYQDNEKTVSGVGFEEPSFGVSLAAKVPRIVQWVKKHSRGRITTDKQASFVLWVFVVVALLVSYLLITSQNSNGNAQDPYPVGSSAFQKQP
jgi:hypothetical protein